MAEEKQPKGGGDPADIPDSDLEANPEVEDFFHRLMEKQDMRRPKPSPEAIAAALQAMHRLQGIAEPGSESSLGFAGDASQEQSNSGCPHCGYQNQNSNQFCGMCGGALSASGSAAPGMGMQPGPGAGEGQHHYHHHYHHHYFAPGQNGDVLMPGMGQRPAGATAAKETGKLHAPLGGAGLSRAEATVRQMTKDWALACNNKQLDDLLSFYATDALVLRPNLPPIRGSAAIREFFFSALDSGLGDIEMEALRVDLLGDVAYEAGRCKMLVPLAVGKRREERGKYVVVFAKQKNGEWKAVVDSWSSDLSLSVTPETASAQAALPPKPRR